LKQWITNEMMSDLKAHPHQSLFPMLGKIAYNRFSHNVGAFSAFEEVRGNQILSFSHNVQTMARNKKKFSTAGEIYNLDPGKLTISYSPYLLHKVYIWM
jgi:hypothetical protein